MPAAEPVGNPSVALGAGLVSTALSVLSGRVVGAVVASRGLASDGSSFSPAFGSAGREGAGSGGLDNEGSGSRAGRRGGRGSGATGSGAGTRAAGAGATARVGMLAVEDAVGTPTAATAGIKFTT